MYQYDFVKFINKKIFITYVKSSYNLFWVCYFQIQDDTFKSQQSRKTRTQANF